MPDNSAEGVKRSASSMIPRTRRQDSTSRSVPGKDDGLNKRVPGTQVGRSDTVLRRKKLPWLDGPQHSKPGHIPGHFDSKESLRLGDGHDSPPQVPEKGPAPMGKRASVSSVGGNPALRATGSTPSLRKRAKSGEFKTYSLSSQRSGVRPAASKQEAERVLGVANEGPKLAGYASSEYSATPSSEKNELPGTFPRTNTSSYERLVDRPQVPDGPNPFHVANRWLQSQLDLPLDEPSPRHLVEPPRALLSPQDSPGKKVVSPASSDSCNSCDRGLTLRDMPKAKTLPRRTTTMPTTDSSAPPPPPRQRKPTLFAMPTHLLPSSSSSSQGPQRRATAPQVQASQIPAPAPAMTVPSVRHQSHALDRAVTGLGNLMEEALSVARDAAQNGRNEDVAQILNSATQALRKASTAHDHMNTGRMSQPLVLSPAVSDRDSDSDAHSHYSDASSIQSTTGHSVETAPTLLTKSAQPSQQPILVDQYKPGGLAPASRKASVEHAKDRGRKVSPDRHSMSRTPPRLYPTASADSIVRDFAYARAKTARAEAARQLSRSNGAASDYYGDTGQSIGTQPGVRPSVSAPAITDKPLPDLPGPAHRPSKSAANLTVPPRGSRQKLPVRQIEPVPTNIIPPRTSSRSCEKLPDTQERPRRRTHAQHEKPHLSDFFESAYYHRHHVDDNGQSRGEPDAGGDAGAPKRTDSSVTDARYDSNVEKRGSVTERYSGPTRPTLQRDISLRHPRRKHISLKEGQGFSLGRYHRRQPIAREWSTSRKRITAAIACLNTVFVGLIAGIYVSDRCRLGV